VTNRTEPGEGRERDVTSAPLSYPITDFHRRIGALRELLTAVAPHLDDSLPDFDDLVEPMTERQRAVIAAYRTRIKSRVRNMGLPEPDLGIDALSANNLEIPEDMKDFVEVEAANVSRDEFHDVMLREFGDAAFRFMNFTWAVEH
jgi:hypothetical protein